MTEAKQDLFGVLLFFSDMLRMILNHSFFIYSSNKNWKEKAKTMGQNIIVFEWKNFVSLGKF